jgi:threonine dehydratase
MAVQLPFRADVIAAQARIKPYVRVTPVMSIDVPTPSGNVFVTLKLELFQQTGSFKARGAFNSVLQSDSDTLIACSGGNHGLAVAFACARLGKRAVIVVPKSSPANKIAAIRAAGAEVHLEGDVPAEAFALAEKLSAQNNWPLIHPYDQLNTVAGAGTHGLELVEQAPYVSHWLIAVGGGGFIAGTALAIDGYATAVAVEPEGCLSLHAAQQINGPIAVSAAGIARTSLGAPSVGTIAWELLRDRVGPVVVVTDDDIVAAQRWLWKYVRIATEPGGATSLAALLSGKWIPPVDSAVGVVLCGANTDELAI